MTERIWKPTRIIYNSMKLTFMTLFKNSSQNSLDSRFNLTRSRLKSYRWLGRRYLVPNLCTRSQQLKLSIPTYQLAFTGDYRFITISSKSSCHFVNSSIALCVAHWHSPQLLYSTPLLYKAFYLNLYKHLNSTLVILQAPLLQWYLSCSSLTYGTPMLNASVSSTVSRYKPRFIQNKL